MTAEPGRRHARADRESHGRRSSIPGGLAARYRWTGSGGIAAITALSEVGGTLTDHGPLVSDDPDRLCRAELRVEGPLGTWTARFASLISDEPDGLLWDTQGLLLVRYGFRVYALEARTGDAALEPRQRHARWSPCSARRVSTTSSSRARSRRSRSTAPGAVVWRVAHTDVITSAELVGGRLVLGRLGRRDARPSTRSAAGSRPR